MYKHYAIAIDIYVYKMTSNNSVLTAKAYLGDLTKYEQTSSLIRSICVIENRYNIVDMYFFTVENKYLPSKSTVPEPSVSISAMMPSKSLELSLSSRAAKISLRVDVVI